MSLTSVPSIFDDSSIVCQSLKKIQQIYYHLSGNEIYPDEVFMLILCFVMDSEQCPKSFEADTSNSCKRQNRMKPSPANVLLTQVKKGDGKSV